jgi:hypothetical protein
MGGYNGLPPSGYRGQSISYPRGGTGGPSGYGDPFATNPVGGYSYNNQVSGPKIATINVRVRFNRANRHFYFIESSCLKKPPTSGSYQ